MKEGIKMLQKTITTTIQTTKEISYTWEGKTYIGKAILKDNIIFLENEKGESFETLEENEIQNGMSLEEIFEEIPNDITYFSLK